MLEQTLAPVVVVSPAWPLLAARQLVCLVVSRSGSAAVIMQLAHVLLQVKVATEALGTDPARVWLFVVVRVHVERQVVDLVKRLVTDLALVLLLA